MNTKNKNFRWWYLLIIIPSVLAVGFLVWAYTPLGPMPEAITALESTEDIEVVQDKWITFNPKATIPDTGMIVYPGGRVDPRSYAPAASSIAQQGYLVVIVPMPLNLAVFGVDKAQDVINAYPDIDNWIIGGHSLGGSMAASFTNGNPGSVDGLFFWASYPAGSDDLSGTGIPVISIYATLDGLATSEDIESSRLLLPPGTIWVEIQGGNHAQFGWYGEQGGDNPATISRESQQTEIINAMTLFLANIETR